VLNVLQNERIPSGSRRFMAADSRTTSGRLPPPDWPVEVFASLSGVDDDSRVVLDDGATIRSAAEGAIVVWT
jgi:hypothetical protein